MTLTIIGCVPRVPKKKPKFSYLFQGKSSKCAAWPLLEIVPNFSFLFIFITNLAAKCRSQMIIPFSTYWFGVVLQKERLSNNTKNPESLFHVWSNKPIKKHCLLLDMMKSNSPWLDKCNGFFGIAVKDNLLDLGQHFAHFVLRLTLFTTLCSEVETQRN